MAASSDPSTEERILNAAHGVFVRHGTDAASLKDIAEEADVNQALVHYYFGDKKTLADTVFEQVAAKFIPRIQEVFVSDQTIEEKVETIVRKYIGLIRGNPYLPLYIVGELNENADAMRERLQSMGVVPFEEMDDLKEQLQKEAEAGRLRPISAEQFVVNVLSLCIFPFIGQPLIEAMFDMDDDAFQRFIEKRKKTLPAFIMDAFRPS